MPALDFRLVATLAALMLLVQAACWLLARGLGLRLSKWAVLGSWLAPLVVLAPWLGGNPLLVSCDILGRGVPGAPAIERSGSHDLLNDTVYQLLPWELEVRHALSDRRLPFWSDALEGGSSPWANPQAGALSPLQMAARALPIQHHLLGTLALKMLVAFQGTWLLARLAGRSRAASLLAAAGFSLGGGLFSWAVFPVTAAAAWIPWMAAGTIRLFRRPHRRIVATTAVITGILLLSGHPETAAFGGLFAAVCGLCLRRRKTGFRQGFAAAALAALLGFGLAAPLILPFLAIVPDSQRARDTLAEKLPSGPVSLRDPLSWFVPGYGAFVLAPVSPHVFGRPYQDPFNGPFNWADAEAGYTGLVAFAGALIALLGARDRRAWPFLGFALASLLLAARFLPLSGLLQLVPVLKVPAYSRCLMPGSLALCVAGAFGVDLLLGHWRDGRGGRVRARPEVLAWTGLGLAALFSLGAVANAWTAGLWITLAAAFALGRLIPRRGSLLGAIALGAVLLTDLIPWSRSLLPEGHPAHFYPKTEIMDVVVREAGDPAVGRGVGGDYLLYPNLLPVYGVADFRPHNPLAPARLLDVLGAGIGFHPRMNEYFAPVRNVDHPLLDFLGVRVVLGSPAVPPSRTLTRIDGGRFAPYTLYRNPDPLPRWFFPEAANRIGRGDVAGWIAKLDDPRRVAVFADEAGSWQPPTGQTVAPRVLSSSPGRLVLEVADGGEKLLASSVPWSRGWSARSGGRRLPTLVVNGAFLGVRVPAGVSRIELRFVPPGFAAGVAAFAVSALIVLLLLVRLPRRTV
ncbi:MAG TPA: YfhO family protein [Thermoanaerobaculia bacterium]|jgi:hypothetical protein|nr:YfhO family protein [Thermoanaerobaculia bacterium]